jgi:hypothetical protein
MNSGKRPLTYSPHTINNNQIMVDKYQQFCELNNRADSVGRSKIRTLYNTMVNKAPDKYAL